MQSTKFVQDMIEMKLQHSTTSSVSYESDTQVINYNDLLNTQYGYFIPSTITFPLTVVH